MKLTDEEKEIFEKDKELSSSFWSEITESLGETIEIEPCNWVKKGIDDVLTYGIDENRKHQSKVTLNFIKRMIIDISKKRGYSIEGEELFDVDELLNGIIMIDEYNDSLIGFNPLYYKDSEKINSYFNELTKNMSWEDLVSLVEELNWTNDGFRRFFLKYTPGLYDLANKLYFELEQNDKDYSKNEDQKNSVINDAEVELTFEIPSAETRTNDDLTEEKLLDNLKFINTIQKLIKYRDLGFDVAYKLVDLMKQKKLQDFYSNEEFFKAFSEVMQHDSTNYSYYFHGTQSVEDAENILNMGLGMMRQDLETTAYKEFSMDDLILYQRGHFGEIGRDAVVIIAVPKDENGKEISVVNNNDFNLNMHFVQSGLQGLDGRPNYIVLPENIVGYVDKKIKKVVFNSKYKEYSSGNTMHRK